ncbi:DNA polymerase III subunit beta [Catenulispora subtropica]|uniref:Beta sliding clamp n=1 Tax=Catenulispora subtropica TaxID=450798 RepID=A0ABN2S528_9ACTN
MRFQVERDVFSEAVAWTARSLPSRPAAPVLAGLLFDAAQGAVTLSGFDYEVSARAEIAADVAAPGRVLVHGRLLADIAKSLPNKPVELVTERSKLLLTCGSSHFTLQTLPVGDYPALPEVPAAAGPVARGSVAGSALAAAVAQVAVAAGRDDTIPMLTGVRVEIEGDRLTLVSTDRFRLAYRELEWKPEQEGVSATALIPAKVFADTARALTGRDQVTIALASGDGEGLAGFESGEGVSAGGGGTRRMTSRLLSGEFVKYRALFPDEYTITATVEAAPFLEAAKRVSLVAERTSPIKLTFTRGEVALEAGAGDEANSSESLEAVLEGEAVSASFNPAFLLDGLRAVGTTYAQLSFTVPGKPTVLMARESLDVPASDDFRYLMLPLKGRG